MRVGFIGLGKQGAPLARNLLEAGHALVVHDVRPEGMAALCEAGAQAASSPADLAARSEVVQICVLDDNQLRQVIYGETGVLAGIAGDAVIIVHSTVSPSLIERIGSDARERGAHVLDAPVSGGERGAIAKTMSFMVGGDDAIFERCRPLFEASGRQITRAGKLGDGARAKLVHQAILVGNRLAAFEGFRLGLASGLSKEILQQIVSQGGAQSRVADIWFTHSSRPHALPVYYKDLQICLGFAHELGVPLTAAAIGQQFLDDIIP